MKGVAALTAPLLQQLAAERLADAEVLFQAGRYSGAWYVSGYVLEVALKAVVCRTLRVPEYPESALRSKAFKTHDVAELVLLAGLQAKLAAEIKNAGFQRNWETVTEWSPVDRYRSVKTKQDVADLLLAYKDPTKGVFPWLTRQW